MPANFDIGLSGMVSNILLSLDDENGTIYPSGKVFQMLFKSVPEVNGLMGVDFSGFFDAGSIVPSPTGQVFQAIFELLVARDLTKKTMFSAARQFNLLSFAEGDSKVTQSDLYKQLSDLHKNLVAEFNEVLRQTKYTLASNAPSSIQGSDGQILDNIPYSQTAFKYPVSYPYP